VPVRSLGPVTAADQERARMFLDVMGLADRGQHLPASCPAANSSAWPSRGRS